MTNRTFLSKWTPLVLRGSAAESVNDKETIQKEFSRDLNTLNYSEITFEQVQILLKALNWVGITFLKERELFLILSVYRKTLDKQEDFSLKDAQEMFIKTETHYVQKGRSVYGGQYFYLNEFFQITQQFDYRTKEDDLRYNSGNYKIEKEELEQLLNIIKIN